MHLVPVFFGKTTMPAHQGVGSSTFKITNIDSILSNSPKTSLYWASLTKSVRAPAT